MPFYSRSSSDGRDRFLGDIMKVIFISSNFTDEIQSHYDSSEANVLQPSSSEEEKIDKTKNNKKDTMVNTLKSSSSNHTCVECVAKFFPTALISKVMKNIQDV